MSENTVNGALKALGYKGRMTAHGFRSTASTILNERGWNKDWIEMQLLHSQNSIRGKYSRAQYLKQRREMLQWWADYLDQLREGARVVPIKTANL